MNWQTYGFHGLDGVKPPLPIWTTTHHVTPIEVAKVKVGHRVHIMKHHIWYIQIWIWRWCLRTAPISMTTSTAQTNIKWWQQILQYRFQQFFKAHMPSTQHLPLPSNISNISIFHYRNWKIRNKNGKANM